MKVSLLVLILFITILSAVVEPSKSVKLRKERRSLSEKLARKLISYFQLDKIRLGADSQEELKHIRDNKENDNSDSCESLSPGTILDYFFDVYSTNSSFEIISQLDLENIVMKQVSDNPLGDDIKARKKKNICNRRNVAI
jgi:hypothetical protein